MGKSTEPLKTRQDVTAETLAGQRHGAYGSGMQGEKIPEPYYEIRPGGVAIVFRFEDINNESNSNQNCELDCESIGGRVKEWPLTHFLALKFACT